MSSAVRFFKENVGKKKILAALFITWVCLWMVFLVREEKGDQYKTLIKMYSSCGPEKIRYIVGPELYDFIGFCKENIPAGATYAISGFEKYSIKEVQSRYLLWPLRSVKNAEYIVLYGSGNVPGYREFKSFEGKGSILKKD